jgi:hypothetical protein
MEKTLLIKQITAYLADVQSLADLQEILRFVEGKTGSVAVPEADMLGAMRTDSMSREEFQRRLRGQ